MKQLNHVITNDGKNSYFQQVYGSGTFTTYNVTNRLLTKSGYVYIYVSNETPNIDVFFDNLQVTHIRGPLLQEQAYYPFGLEMKAISSQAALKPETRYKYDAGNELEDNFDVNYYETPYRNYDPQIGRFTSVDPLAEWYYHGSTYQYAANDPIYFNDPSGLAFAVPSEPVDPLGGMSLWSWVGFYTGYWGDLSGFGGGGGGGGGSGFGGGGGGYPHGGGGGGGGNPSGQHSTNENINPPLFNTSKLTPPEIDRFNYLIEQIETVPVGQALINSLNTCGKIIFITHDNPKREGAAGSYDAPTNTLRMLNKLDPNEGFADQYVLKTLTHELFHALQDFSGITSAPAKEIDAYLFQSLFGRQYKMDAQYYDEAITNTPVTQNEKNFTNAWNNFFNNGYSGSDYRDLYRYFLYGSPANAPDENGQRLYGNPRSLNPNDGGYAIYWFLSP